MLFFMVFSIFCTSPSLSNVPDNKNQEEMSYPFILDLLPILNVPLNNNTNDLSKSTNQYKKDNSRNNGGKKEYECNGNEEKK